MSLYRDRGVVLRTYKLGEADRIVVVLTAAHGKVRAVAKGARRGRSRLGARLEPLSHVDLLMYEGRGELDVVSQADLVEPWRAFRDDLGRLSQGLAMAEAAEHVAQDGDAAASAPLYRMLVGALRELVQRPGPLVAACFYWKLLALDGAQPVLGSCASCGGTPPAVDLVAFDIGQGGALCRTCRRGLAVSPAALEVTTWALSGQLGRALQVPPGPLAAEVAHLATVTLEAHLERRLKALHLLEVD